MRRGADSFCQAYFRPWANARQHFGHCITFHIPLGFDADYRGYVAFNRGSNCHSKVHDQSMPADDYEAEYLRQSSEAGHNLEMRAAAIGGKARPRAWGGGRGGLMMDDILRTGYRLQSTSVRPLPLGGLR
jgi:hypothetical protein